MLLIFGFILGSTTVLAGELDCYKRIGKTQTSDELALVISIENNTAIMNGINTEEILNLVSSSSTRTGTWSTYDNENSKLTIETSGSSRRAYVNNLILRCFEN